MKIAYFTTDQANEDLALQMADRCGMTLYPVTLADPPPDHRVDVVLYDWDSLPWLELKQRLADSLARTPFCLIAVHSSSLEEDEVQGMHQDGVAVFHNLEPTVFEVLRRLAKVRIPQRRRPRRRELAPA